MDLEDIEVKWKQQCQWSQNASDVQTHQNHMQDILDIVVEFVSIFTSFVDLPYYI